MRLALTCGLTVFASLSLSGCASAPGRPLPSDVPETPSAISDFNVLYRANCSGCHGADGAGGAAIALGNPVYLAIVDDAAIRRAASDGVPGTSMPAFAQSAGGMLTDQQIAVLVKGIRERWSKPNALGGASAPPYSSPEAGNAARGSNVYATHCQSCHGSDGHGGQKASSIVDGSFLALLSDQELRTIVIVGRPELGAPDWRNDTPGRPMSAQDVSDVVAWLAAQRPRFPGQPYPTNTKSMGETP
ncbi:MAG TPA: c-type cytochrome [Candidatus Sulfotelmatobacter sp.]|nr:c-type cytochrome [Candidatus Sulfotelmatobacter sp.]